jgi:hypothetical protein
VPYLGYLVFMRALQTLGLGPGSIVFEQWLISVIVVVAIYDLGRRLASPLAGSLAATLYALNADITRFTFYVLSDSLFASLLLLSLYSTYRAATDARRWHLIAAGTILGVAVLRVNGWLMSPMLFEWLIRSRVSGRRRRWLVRAGVGGCYGACVLIGFSAINTGAVGYELLRTGRVIWFDPESWIAMPPSVASASLRSPAVAYVWEHPLAVTDLMIRRVIVEVAHTRRFYSRRHNVMAGVAVWGLYVLAGIGCYTHRHAAIVRVTLLLVTVQLFIVAMTAADWDGRFLIAVLPLVTVWSGVGLARLLSATPGPIGCGFTSVA